jgi:hypothetical protein
MACLSHLQILTLGFCMKIKSIEKHVKQKCQPFEVEVNCINMFKFSLTLLLNVKENYNILNQSLTL